MKRINISEEEMKEMQARADRKVKAEAKELMDQIAKDIEIPEDDHSDPLHLVGIGTNLNGNADFVFDSAEELIWDLVDSGAEYSKERWNRLLESTIHLYVRGLSESGRRDEYLRYINEDIDPMAWYHEAEEEFDSEVENLRGFVEDNEADISPWINSALNYAEEHFADQKKSIIREMAEDKKEEAMSLFMKLDRGEQCETLRDVLDTKCETTNDAVDFIIRVKLAEKYIVVPFSDASGSNAFPLLDLSLKYKGDYTGFLVADREAFVREYFPDDDFNERNIIKIMDILMNRLLPIGLPRS